MHDCFSRKTPKSLGLCWYSVKWSAARSVGGVLGEPRRAELRGRTRDERRFVIGSVLLQSRQTRVPEQYQDASRVGGGRVGHLQIASRAPIGEPKHSGTSLAFSSAL
jgi:hypothetical protein